MIQALRNAIRGRRLRGDRGQGDDAGFAMILVVGYGLTITLVMSLLAGYVLSSMSGSRREQDYYSAIEAAQAGVDDLMSRLYLSDSPGASDWTGWTPIPGAESSPGVACVGDPLPANCAAFRHRAEVDPATPGTVTITSVGRLRAITRAVQVEARQRSFGDYLYFSDIEAIDPSDGLVPGVQNHVLLSHAQNCAQRAWDAPRDPNCNEPVFRTGDLLSGGRIHTNDVFLLQGSPNMDGPISTAFPDCAPAAAPAPADCYRVVPGSSAALNRTIAYEPEFGLPENNDALKVVAAASGCVYTGPTRIKFKTDGTMDVWSPQTPKDLPGAARQCGGGISDNLLGVLGGTATGVLGGLLPGVLDLDALSAIFGNPRNVPVPDGSVIYVQEPTTPLDDPLSCQLKNLLGLSSATLDVNLQGGCNAGSLIVDGVVNGRVTAAAADDITIMDDITYAGGLTGDDALGLVANGSVEVYNPVQCTAALSTGCLSGNLLGGAIDLVGYLTGRGNIDVHASILALNGRFGVQLSNVVPTLPLFGTPKLNLRGSVAQKHAGYVGGPLELNVLGATGPLTLDFLNTGFAKDYQYDPRLRENPPPFFPAPEQAPLERNAFAEIDVPVVP